MENTWRPPTLMGAVNRKGDPCYSSSKCGGGGQATSVSISPSPRATESLFYISRKTELSPSTQSPLVGQTLTPGAAG